MPVPEPRYQIAFKLILVIALFVLLGVVAFAVGYVVRDRLVSTSLNPIPAKPTSAPLGLGDNVATRVTIEAAPIAAESLRGSYFFVRSYKFENGQYSVSFNYSTVLELKDFYSDPEHGDKFADFDVWFSMLKEYDTEASVLSIHAKSNRYCWLGLCDEPTLATEDIFGTSWEYLGQKEYCDAGYCGANDHTYRMAFPDYTAYIKSPIPLDSDEAKQNEYVTQILTSLRFTAN